MFVEAIPVVAEPALDPEVKDEILETLQIGMDLIKAGWIQDEFTDGKGNYCMLGAVTAFDEDRQELWRNPEVEKYLVFGIMQSNDLDCDDVASWNDEHYRTHQEVIEAYETAIEIRKSHLRR